MKKLLSIVISAITLGVFADAGKGPMTFELRNDIAAGDTVCLTCGDTTIHTHEVTDTDVEIGSITYSTSKLAAGKYYLTVGDEQVTEEGTVTDDITMPQTVSAKFATTDTAIAVWESAFGLTQGGLTIVAPSGSTTTIGDTITVGDAGAYISQFATGCNAFTAIIKYSGLNLEASGNQTLFTAKNSANDNNIGVFMQSKNGGLKGIAKGGEYGSATATTLPASGTIAFAHSSGAGTTVLLKGSETVIYNHGSLRYGSDNYDGITIFSEADGTQNPVAGVATGVIIEKIAIFNAKLTQEQVNSYLFPSESTEYVGTITGDTTFDNISWEGTAPSGDLSSATITITGSGNVTGFTGAAHKITIGEGVTFAADGVTGGILSGAGFTTATDITATIDTGSTLTIATGSYTGTKLTNNGTINVTGGTDEAPVTFTLNGATHSSVGQVVLAENAVAKMISTGPAAAGNRKITVTGAGASSKLIVHTNVNCGLSADSQIRSCTMVVEGSEFWCEAASYLDATVNLVLNSKMHYKTTGTIGTLSGSADITSDGNVSALTVTMNGSSTYGGNSNVPLTIAGTGTLTLTSNKTGTIVMDSGNISLPDGFTGTVDISAKTISSAINAGENTWYNVYGKEGSTIKVPEFTGYIPAAAQIKSKLNLAGNWNLNDGYTGSDNTSIAGITGSGNLRIGKNVNANRTPYIITIADMTGYTGTITVEYNFAIRLPNTYTGTVNSKAKVVGETSTVYYSTAERALFGKSVAAGIATVTITDSTETLPSDYAGYTIDENGKIVVAVTQDDVDDAVADVSAAIVSLINGADSAAVTIPTGVTIKITGAVTLEGLAATEAATTTIVGDGTAKTVTRPTIDSTTAGFYKVEATTAK